MMFSLDSLKCVAIIYAVAVLWVPVVHAVMVLTPSVTETTRDLGENILIICETETPDSPHWFGPDGTQIPSDAEVGLAARVFAAEQTTFSRLFVNRAEEGDGGVYTCRTDTEEATLQLILQLPLRIESAPSPQQTGLGSDYKIVCQVTSPTTPTFTWYYRGDVIDIDATPRYTLAADGLMITDVMTSDAGPYTCEALNPDTGDSDFQDIVFNVMDDATPQALDSPSASQLPSVSPTRTLNVTSSRTAGTPNITTETGEGTGDTARDNTSAVVGGGLAGMVLLMAVIVSLYIVYRNNVKRREGRSRGRVNTADRAEDGGM
ncbi:neural cell adhesion molecule 2-like isoform X2 [Branchiostoma floridae]|uniref:Neural cell adhesion molecule 2-like isoform X2 n=1 Tax=Branchiostoma floridae TaxID=7739 RepID=A0A9J7M9W8_BRAFL|nr:neural cell adhesion molecule 2-like isoform X2 [Branchiostoma floridae]